MGQETLQSHQLVISSVSRDDVGVYTCTASNGVGSPATAAINLQVLCKYFLDCSSQRFPMSLHSVYVILEIQNT